MPSAAIPSDPVFPGRRWQVPVRDGFALAEAVGQAWCERRCGGRVELVGDPLRHPWWPMLRAWLPADAPLSVVAALDLSNALPDSPWPPVALTSLPRSGVPPVAWPDVPTALAWLREREPHLLVVEAPSHPALAVAHAMIAGNGVRVCWHLHDVDWAQWLPALRHIGQRQLPLQLICDALPPEPIPGWWIATPAGRGATAAALVHHLQHEWPGIIVPGSGPDDSEPWQPGHLRVLREGREITVCLPCDADRISGGVACPTTVQPAPRARGASFHGPAAWAAALGYAV